MEFKRRVVVVLKFLLAIIPLSELCNPPNPNVTAPFPFTPPSFVFTTASINLFERLSSTPSPRVPEVPPVLIPQPPKATISLPNPYPQIDNNLIESFQHILVTGMPFQRGQSHGMQAREKIHKLITLYKEFASMPPWEECVELVNKHFLPAIQKYYPNGFEEMKGIAQGANVTLQDIIILNSRHELVQWKQSRQALGEDETEENPRKSSYDNVNCANKGYLAPETRGLPTIGPFSNGNGSPVESSMPPKKREISKSGQKEPMVGIGTGAVSLSSSNKYSHTLLGQNWDAPEAILKNDLVIILEVHPEPCEGISPIVTLAEAGQLGVLGFNADGLGVVGNSLWSTGDKLGLHHPANSMPSLLLRRIFLESPSFSQGLQRILPIPRESSTNLVIATAGDEALNIELSPVDYHITKVPLKKDYIGISNNFKFSSFSTGNNFQDNYNYKDISSIYRDRRVERHLALDWPRIDEKSFQNGFSDHVGHPDAVCRHPSKHTELTTISSVILNLSQKTLQITKGPPCSNAFKYLKFEFSQL